MQVPVEDPQNAEEWDEIQRIGSVNMDLRMIKNNKHGEIHQVSARKGGAHQVSTSNFELVREIDDEEEIVLQDG